TSDPHDQGPFNPAAFTSPDASWVESIGLGWSPPDGAPSVGPWVRTGTSDATALDLLAGGGLYASGGDNVNTGEHDGMDGQYASGNVFDGSPDGGGMYLNWQPAAGADTMAGWASVITGVLSDRSPAGLAPVLENPVPVANAGFGAGFDGPYVGLYTSRQTMYQGGGGSNSSTNGQRDIYNYQEPNGQPKDWSPANCSNGSAAGEQACTTQPGSNGTTASCPPGETNNANDTSCGANYYKQQEASNVTSEPGVMVYNNPDPQSSGSNGTPGAYLGTCGAVVPTGAMDLPSAPSQAGPVAYTNSAGQTVVADPTGC
ncbi:MAG TPA: hypothetical protein VMV14_01000, partial [Acidimicrobiales bacterium]|nr:hypothetical protein [Acidimicrobiales bacterium]